MRSADYSSVYTRGSSSLIIISILIYVLVAAFLNPLVLCAADSTADLCGGTGGNGQIINIGIDSFTLTQNNGNPLVVTFAGQANIETSSGPVALSDLKIGDRVTLVGTSHRDGTFSADTVLLCAATENASTSPETSSGAINSNSNYDHVNGILTEATLLCVGLVWLGIAAYLLLKKRKGVVYLLFFTIFYIYFYEVINVTLIQFQSLLLLEHFVPNLMLRGLQAGRTVNLIPLITLRLVDVKTTLLNVLMMMPFGFGLPFITNFRFKKVVVVGLLVSITIEFLQFITGFISNTTFRIADINDVIFNTLGVAVGFILFVAFVRTFRRVIRHWRIGTNPLLRYIAERPQVK
ncbi:MAG TPA: VanZ family protein [Candidatus Paceibacterota bacterium]|nr:VanZ family protein [Candidatus Paceibacterota bacterium]